MLGRHLPNVATQPADRHRPRGIWLGGEILGDQQGHVAVGALFRHPYVGELVVGVDHRDPFRAHLGDQTGGVLDPSGDRPALADQVGALVLGELVVIDDGIIEQPAGQPVAKRPVAQLVGVGDGLVGQLGEPRPDVVGVDGRRAAGTGQQRREHPAAYVVQRVAAVAQIGVLLAGDPIQHAEREQQPDHRHEVGTFVPAAEGEGDPGAGQFRVARRDQHPFGQPAKGDLGVRRLQHRQREAQQDVAAPPERRSTLPLPRRVRVVLDGRRRLEQPRRLGVDDQPPAGFGGEPLAQLGGVPADQPQDLVVRAGGA